MCAVVRHSRGTLNKESKNEYKAPLQGDLCQADTFYAVLAMPQADKTSKRNHNLLFGCRLFKNSNLVTEFRCHIIGLAFSQDLSNLGRMDYLVFALFNVRKT